jgi:polyphosphate kinase
MQRNLDRRVEILAPIEDPRLKKHLKVDILDRCLHDNVKARRLLVNGTYQRIQPQEGEERLDVQSHFIHTYDSVTD